MDGEWLVFIGAFDEVCQVLLGDVHGGALQRRTMYGHWRRGGREGAGQHADGGARALELPHWGPTSEALPRKRAGTTDETPVTGVLSPKGKADKVCRVRRRVAALQKVSLSEIVIRVAVCRSPTKARVAPAPSPSIQPRPPLPASLRLPAPRSAEHPRRGQPTTSTNMFCRNALALFTLLSIPYLSAAVSLNHHDDHDHPPLRKRLPTAWHHEEGHPVYQLFKREPTTDGVNYAPVGSPEWSAGYPPAHPEDFKIPQAWVDALDAAVAAGKIPNIPPATATGGNPTYGALDPNGDEVCSTTYKCRKNDYIWDAPEGVFSTSFDDGPLPEGEPLYAFLEQNNVQATHFFIGINILNNPNMFKRAYNDIGGDIAVHTWTHRYMTTLDNHALLGEFGFTMQIIHNSTGGRLPKYWRPPYGDSDRRVSAIAKEIFGMQTVIWNQDTEDWSIGQAGAATAESVRDDLTKWITGPKAPGLMILEHELNNNTVSAFINAYPLIVQNGWKVVSVAQLDGGSAYQNADGLTGPVAPASGVLVGSFDDDEPASSSSGASSGSSSPTSASSGASAASTGGTKASSQSSSSSVPAASATGASQTNGARSVTTLFGDLYGMLAAAATLFVALA